MEKYIFITGDSFCATRHRESNWPVKLASNLGATLVGEGFAGQCWWHAYNALKEYSKTPEFNNTEYFVFCHTDTSRLLTANNIDLISLNEHEKVYEVYLKYIQSEALDHDIQAMLFLKLNQILDGKKVIHVNSFGNPNIQEEFNKTLNGMKVGSGPQNCLVAYSWVDLTGERTTDYLNNIRAIIDDPRANHFTDERNINLANILANAFNKYEDRKYISLGKLL